MTASTRALAMYRPAGLMLGAALALAVSAPGQALDCPAFRLPENTETAVGRCYEHWTLGLFRQLGCPVTLVNTGKSNRGRRLEQFQAGDVNILVGFTPTPEREHIAQLSRPYAQVVVRLYVRKGETGAWPIRELCDPVMRRAQLAGPSSGPMHQTYESVLEARGCLGRVVYYRNTPEQGMDMLLNRRVDILLLSETQWLRLPEALRARTEPLAVRFPPDTLHLLLRKDIARHWLDRLNRAIAEELDAHGPPCGTMALPAPG